MRRLSILSCFLIIIIFASCEDENVKKLKKQVRTIDALCPVNAGISGDFLSIKYDEDDKKVYMYFASNEEFGSQFFLKESRENIMTNLKLMFQDPESHQMLKDMVNAKAGLVVIYKIPSNGKTAEYEIPYDDLKNILDHPISEQERVMMIIKNKVSVENNKCPYAIETGVIMVKNALIDENVVFYIQVDEDLFDFKDFKNAQNDIKEDAKQTFREMKGDLTMQSELRLLAKAGLGYHYRYFGNKTKDYFDIIFTSEELSKYLR